MSAADTRPWIYTNNCQAVTGSVPDAKGQHWVTLCGKSRCTIPHGPVVVPSK